MKGMMAVDHISLIMDGDDFQLCNKMTGQIFKMDADSFAKVSELVRGHFVVNGIHPMRINVEHTGHE